MKSCFIVPRFLSVVVITCPSHGQGRRFDPGRNQSGYIFAQIFINYFIYTLENPKVVLSKRWCNMYCIEHMYSFNHM